MELVFIIGVLFELEDGTNRPFINIIMPLSLPSILRRIVYSGQPTFYVADGSSPSGE